MLISPEIFVECCVVRVLRVLLLDFLDRSVGGLANSEIVEKTGYESDDQGEKADHRFAGGVVVMLRIAAMMIDMMMIEIPAFGSCRKVFQSVAARAPKMAVRVATT